MLESLLYTAVQPKILAASTLRFARFNDVIRRNSFLVGKLNAFSMDVTARSFRAIDLSMDF
jgi:hypothetical protein